MQCRQQHADWLTLLEHKLQAKEADVCRLQAHADAGHAQQLSDLKALHEQTEQHDRQQLEVQAMQLHQQYEQVVISCYLILPVMLWQLEAWQQALACDSSCSVLQISSIKAKHGTDLKAATDSLTHRLQHLQLDLSCQAASAAQQAADLDSCQTDKSQLVAAVDQLRIDIQLLKSCMESLQADKRQLQDQHQVWAWRLAKLQHWRQSGFSQQRLVLRTWAALASVAVYGAARSGPQIQGHGSCPDSIVELQLHQLTHEPDSCRYHNSRMLGYCFRGKALL